MRMISGVVCVAAAVIGGGVTVFAGSSFPAHRGDSPWSFTAVAEPSSRFVVNDTDSPTIDRYLLHSQGPIEIDVPIRRYVGPVGSDGKLLDAAGLKAKGIIGDTATITLPAYDVDVTTPPATDCDGDGVIDSLRGEIDDLFLNGTKIGTLKGRNNVWVQNTFSVPIDQLKFPGAPGQTAINKFKVNIDAGNENVVLSSGKVGCDRWAVTIDWIGIKFDASSPVVLVHGIRSQGSNLGNFKAGLADQKVLATDNSITLIDPAAPGSIPAGCASSSYNDSIKFNVDQLRNLVPAIAQQFGSETVHFVTHSKGGLDTRGLLSKLASSPIPIEVGRMGGQAVKQDLEARSLVTLNTPHAGSVLAEYGVEAREITRSMSVRTNLNIIAAKALEGAYYCDLTPQRASTFIASTSLPAATQRASVATNADCNGDRSISNNMSCSGGQTEAQDFTGGDYAGDRLYKLVGGVASVSISVVPRRFFPDDIFIVETPTTPFQPNDIIVTTTSAGLYPLYGITGWHHMNVHSRTNGSTIAADAEASGRVDWRKR